MCNDGIRTVSRPKYSINAQTPSASKETFFLPVLFLYICHTLWFWASIGTFWI